jgi:hypothetical protein
MQSAAAMTAAEGIIIMIIIITTAHSAGPVMRPAPERHPDQT